MYLRNQDKEKGSEFETRLRAVETERSGLSSDLMGMHRSSSSPDNDRACSLGLRMFAGPYLL